MFLKKHKTFLKDVLMYTLTSFGGPQGHLGMMLKTFVQKKKYLSEEEFFEFNSICQILPGASSTQLLGTIGYKKGGIALSILTLLIWITPASILLGLLSFYVNHQSNNTNTNEFFKYVQPMVIGFIFLTTYISAKKNINNKITFIITLITTILMYLFFKSPWIFPIVMLLGSLSGLLIKKQNEEQIQTKKRKLNWILFVLFAGFFLTAASVSETARKENWPNRTPYNLFENMYRFGSFVFGGADVLIPVMYEQYVVRPETNRIKASNQNVIRIDREEFLTGAGIVRAIPGPAFSISSFIGAASMQNKGVTYQVLGATIATVGIFLPSFLIGVFLFPLWENLHRYKILQRLLSGLNATVVGIMFASIVFLTKDTLAPLQTAPVIDAFLFFSVMSATFFLLVFTKVKAPFIAAGCLLWCRRGWLDVAASCCR
jgi:chromate transporter